MKKLLSLVIAASFILILAACTAQSAKTTTTANTTATPSTTASSPDTGETPADDTLVIVADGKSEFCVVYPENYSPFELSAAKLIYESIKDTVKVSGLKLRDDFTKNIDSTANTYEIVVGTTNRVASARAAEGLSTDQFSITVSGNKVVILGSTPIITKLAAKTFVSEYIKGERIEVPKEMIRKFNAVPDGIEYKEIKNPVYEVGNDPWVFRKGDDYYYCWSEGGVKVRKISNLDDIKTNGGNVVWTPPAGTMYSHELWAPELHYLNGEWYIYVAADDGNNNNHRMYVLKGTSQDPTHPFKFVGQITDPTNKWAIDGTVMTYKGEMYFIWSGWEGDVNVSQNIYIAHMKDPTTIDSERVCISVPEKEWETIGTPFVNEGPVAITNDETNTAIIVYSGSGSWTDDYCLASLTLTGDDPLDKDAWTKSAQPLMSKKAGAYGPGHCCFVEGYDGELYVTYHANVVSGSSWGGRSCRVQKVEWDGTNLVIGDPATPSDTVLIPYKGYKAIEIN